MMYATKRRRRTVKPVKPPMKDPPKSNPSKRHRERLNAELDHLASLLPFEQSVISKLDKLSVLRLAASYFRIKSYFRAGLHERYALTGHHSHAPHPMAHSHHMYAEPAFVDTDSVLQAASGFMFIVTCDGEVFFASRTVEQYLGFHQSDIIHQSVLELIHSEDREEFKNQLNWRSQLPQDHQDMTLQQVMLPENSHYLTRCFTVRFRCLLDNTSGFITLEISGKLKYLHGQSLKSEQTEPLLALFAICCPFGPVPMLDMPPRDYTFKSKHKMDMAPVSMDPRGKILFGYSDQELMERGGYDLIHPDDLNYYAAAHQELIKTGSSGLIAYRLMTKDMRWIWLQTSSKVVYKNSKPDFVICTHRHLTEDEGKDLFGKRGSEFKLPYPIIDADPSGFGAALEEEDLSKVKPSKKKSKTQLKDYLQAGRKRKTPYREVYNGLNGYSSAYTGLNGYTAAGYGVSGDMKNELLTSYTTGATTNPLSLETAADLYRNGYPSFAATGMYPPGTESLARLDVDRHGYTNGFYYDSMTRPYQHSLQYPSNGYSDLVSHSKYGYDMSKYSYDSFMGSGYGLDLAKRNSYYDSPKYESSSYRGYETQGADDKLSSRLNGSYESLRKSSLYESSGGHLMNSTSGLLQCNPDGTPIGSPPSLSSCPVVNTHNNDLTSSRHTSQNLVGAYSAKETTNNGTSSDYHHHQSNNNSSSSGCGVVQNVQNCTDKASGVVVLSQQQLQQQPLSGYTSVIRSTSPRCEKSPTTTNYSTNTNNGQHHPSTPQATQHSDCELNSWPTFVGKTESSQHSGGGGGGGMHVPSTGSNSENTSALSNPSPTSAMSPDHTTASGGKLVDSRSHSTDNCRGIAVPVVRSCSSWLHHPHPGGAINPQSSPYDWHIPAHGATHESLQRPCGESSVLAHTRAHIIEPAKAAILRDGERSVENPLLSFSQVAHTLLSTG